MDKKDIRLKIDSCPGITDFQRKVYKAILDIPGGSARSYKWVAKKIGRPRAYRAVGSALKKNPFMIIVPCHRVIKSDGSMGGYAKGVQKKIALLKKEGYIAW